jgi:hypothetical protein
MGVSQRYIDKYFSVSPQLNGENGGSNSDSSLPDAVSKWFHFIYLCIYIYYIVTYFL